MVHRSAPWLKIGLVMAISAGCNNGFNAVEWQRNRTGMSKAAALHVRNWSPDRVRALLGAPSSESKEIFTYAVGLCPGQLGPDECYLEIYFSDNRAARAALNDTGRPPKSPEQRRWYY